MKIKLGTLRKLVNENGGRFGSGRLNFYHGRVKFDPIIHTDKDVREAVWDLFEIVAADLGVDDDKDPAFIQYARDTMSNYGVPSDVMDKVVGRVR